MRSSNGCWTCRLRRKKCDENQPVCANCAALYIECHYQEDKPEWMDGGARQEETARRVKREVKEKAYCRRVEQAVHGPIRRSIRRVPGAESRATGELNALPQQGQPANTSPMSDLEATTDILYNATVPSSLGATPTLWLQHGADCTSIGQGASGGIEFGHSDAVLFTFYLEYLFPFLFPFYRPSLFQGGRAWILEMMMRSPVVRQATLCQSSYFFSLARRKVNTDVVWEKVLSATGDAFMVLRRSLEVIDGTDITEHLHSAVRVLASIMQVHRFEIAILRYCNWQTHLNAALAIFRQLLDTSGFPEPTEASSNFKTVMCRLSSPWTMSPQCRQIPSAEQSAFQFSSALMILDDIIASTVLQEQPRLYEYHTSLLIDNNADGTEPPINLEAIVGCQNWALVHIGEIAALDAWKQRRKAAGNLDVIELAHRASNIKKRLVAHLTRLENESTGHPPRERSSRLLHFFSDNHNCRQSNVEAGQDSSLVTRVWAHAALVYLSVVVSGWQPASADVRHHVTQTIELLTLQMSQPELLRTMLWPFCVAGCLAEPAQKTRLHAMVAALQPPSIFGTVHRVLEIMENVWRNRGAGDTNGDIAVCFKSQGDLVLLV